MRNQLAVIINLIYFASLWIVNVLLYTTIYESRECLRKPGSRNRRQTKHPYVDSARSRSTETIETRVCEYTSETHKNNNDRFRSNNIAGTRKTRETLAPTTRDTQLSANQRAYQPLDPSLSFSPSFSISRK